MHDYKIVGLHQDSRGGGVRGTVRVYSGSVTTEKENVRGEMVLVTRYRRKKLVLEKDVIFNSDNPKKIRNAIRAELKARKNISLIPEENVVE